MGGSIMDLVIVISVAALICGTVSLAMLGLIYLIEDREYRNYKARYDDERI
jgi:hypothetical protein